MEIGQKVRFLNEVGGGIISGFQGKDIVLVEDEDGFDIPMLKSQVVVIETNANNFEMKKPAKEQKPVKTPATVQVSARDSKPLPNAADYSTRILEDGADDDPADRPVNYKAKPQERRGGDSLNVHLAFIPENVRELTQTRFESYLINDSNYFLHVVVATAENAAWHLMWQGTVEPNTKMLLNTFERGELPQMERLSVQLHTWKEDKPFVLKPAFGTELRLDTVKFYKLHVFQQSPFFREPALLYDIVSHDEAAEEFDVEEAFEQAEAAIEKDEKQRLKEAKRLAKAEAKERERQRTKPSKPFGDDVIEVDLHISALLDNTTGLSNAVLMNTQLTEFRTIMERNKNKQGQKIVFIHGKGEGVLREAIIKELRHRYRTCTYQDASFREYGFGATLVTIQ